MHPFHRRREPSRRQDFPHPRRLRSSPPTLRRRWVLRQLRKPMLLEQAISPRAASEPGQEQKPPAPSLKPPLRDLLDFARAPLAKELRASRGPPMQRPKPPFAYSKQP